MKVRIFVNDKEEFIDAEKILVNSITLENLVRKFVKLETEFQNYKKAEEQRIAKVKKTWEKMRS